MNTTTTRRQQATADLARAREAIDTMFDRHDELTAACELAVTRPLPGEGGDIVRYANKLLAHAATVAAARDALAAAAAVAADHRTKSLLATDLGTTTRTLFPRSSSPGDLPHRTGLMPGQYPNNHPTNIAH